ncbi:MAG TPA: hypothetical protein VFZ59_09070 [Verrucomicrobiae bacterium]|nr:hypothetical protein [Verrucomicrobiae bacterium]
MQIPIPRIAGTRCAVCVLALVVTATASSAQVNSWINPGSGNWDQPSSWSLGVRPDSSQAVFITNEVWKAVAINPSTPVNFPASMAVDNLTIRGASNTLNTLLLNFAGTAVPLTVANALTLAGHAQILNFNSALVVQSGTITVTNSQIIQDGGLVRCMNATMNLQSATYHLTNGVFEAGVVNLGLQGASTFNQYGGTATFQNLVYFVNWGGTYSLYGGIARFPNGLSIVSRNSSEAGFLQAGGSNFVTTLLVAADLDGASPYYTLENGFLGASNVFVQAGGAGPIDFTQDGGVHVVTNELRLQGRVRSSSNFKLASYVHNNGTLQAGSIVLDEVADFVQSSGVTRVSGSLSLGGDPFFRRDLSLSGGTLGVSNVTYGGAGMNVIQTGGSFQVTNTLSFGGEATPGHALPTFTFQNGTLTAGNIEMIANLIIGSGIAGRISNPGFFKLAGTVRIDDANESLGQFILATNLTFFGPVTNSTINLAGNSSRLSFASSSSSAWIAAATLEIVNWNGSLTGGGAEQLKFGTSQSGLTPAQLSQIRFRIGNDVFPARILSTGEVVPDQGTVPGFVNSWINPGNGNWDQPSNWSLGVRPNSSQSVFITNSNWKAVAINPSTPVDFPDAMTVNDLTIRGAFDTRNTLLLNFFGTTVPLTVSNGLTVADNAQILNFNSGLDIRSGTITVTNAQIVQDGGYFGALNATLNLFNGAYELTNGLFEAGSVAIGLDGDSHFNQYGGQATILNLSFPFIAAAGTGSRGISLYGGLLNLPGGMPLQGRSGSVVSYLQEGGTNQTTDILMEPGLNGPSPDFTLNGGLLTDNNVSVIADTIVTTLEQNGGTHIVSNTLQLLGGARTGVIRPAIYELNGGTLSARLIDLGSRFGDAVYIQSNGVAQAGQIQADGFPFSKSELTLAGGTLSSSNLFLTNGANLHQCGGALVVSNLLSLTGFREPGPRIFTRYEFLGGTLSATNINAGGDFIIGNGSANRISNPGTISLGHLLQISNAVEQLGRFILVTNAILDLAGNASRLSFANSSGQTWAGSATLVVSNWNGNLAGGGAEQLRFGTDQSGLTSAQLNQIRFRVGSDLYTARILNTGEVVPDQIVSPGVNLEFSRQGNNLLLTWPTGFTLQSSTVVTGPYTDVPAATSPYAVDMTLEPQRFFRLRQ